MIFDDVGMSANIIIFTSPVSLPSIFLVRYSSHASFSLTAQPTRT